MKHSEVPRDVCCIIQSDKVTVYPALRGVWLCHWWGWGQMCVQLQFGSFAGAFLPTSTATSPPSSNWAWQLSSEWKTQTGSSQRAVTQLLLHGNQQQVGRGTVEPQGPKERKCSFLLSLLLSTAPSTEAPLLSVLVRQALRESTAAQ